MLRAVADRDPESRRKCIALAQAIVESEVVTLARAVIDSDPRLITRRGVELATVIVESAAPNAAETSTGSAAGDHDE